MPEFCVCSIVTLFCLVQQSQHQLAPRQCHQRAARVETAVCCENIETTIGVVVDEDAAVVEFVT